MPSAVLTHILNRIIYPNENTASLKDIILDAKKTVNNIFKDDKHLAELDEIIDLAVDLAGNNERDEDNIKRIGEGWVAEETLGIAIYCSLKYEHDFSKGIIAAVNHDGDSDSTGAVTGNILGAINGFSSIDNRWIENLELLDILMEMSFDLCHGCQMDGFSSYRDDDWMRKYVDMRWKDDHVANVFFWHEYEENGCFSNWYECPFVIDDFKYLHVEQYLMAQKAKLFHDADRYTAILKATTPDECKKLGRAVTPFDSSEWVKVRYSVLRKGVSAKFSQNKKLKEALLATGNAVLAEASPYDDIYGIKLTAEAALDIPPEKWLGRNLLGSALMDVRH